MKLYFTRKLRAASHACFMSPSSICAAKRVFEPNLATDERRVCWRSGAQPKEPDKIRSDRDRRAESARLKGIWTKSFACSSPRILCHMRHDPVAIGGSRNNEIRRKCMPEEEYGQSCADGPVKANTFFFPHKLVRPLIMRPYSIDESVGQHEQSQRGLKLLFRKRTLDAPSTGPLREPLARRKRAGASESFLQATSVNAQTQITRSFRLRKHPRKAWWRRVTISTTFTIKNSH